MPPSVRSIGVVIGHPSKSAPSHADERVTVPRRPCHAITIVRPPGAARIATARLTMPGTQPATSNDHEVLTDFAGALLVSLAALR
jgi:hypothetical protein